MRPRQTAVFVVALLAWAPPGHATTNVCENRPDGTDCTSDCLAGGKCVGGKCKFGVPAPDGVPCASGNFCTEADFCQSGACLAGRPFVCPTRDCYDVVCLPKRGCVYQLACDMARPPPDLRMPPSDLAAPRDGSANSDGSASGDGSANSDGGPGSDGPIAPPDGAPARTDGGLDAALDDGAAPAPVGPNRLFVPGIEGLTPDERREFDLRVHGSGCTVAVGPGGSPGAAILIVLALLCLPGRRRRERTGRGTGFENSVACVSTQLVRRLADKRTCPGQPASIVPT